MTRRRAVTTGWAATLTGAALTTTIAPTIALLALLAMAAVGLAAQVAR